MPHDAHRTDCSSLNYHENFAVVMILFVQLITIEPIAQPSGRWHYIAAPSQRLALYKAKFYSSSSSYLLEPTSPGQPAPKFSGSFGAGGRSTHPYLLPQNFWEILGAGVVSLRFSVENSQEISGGPPQNILDILGAFTWDYGFKNLVSATFH